jgi:RHS repeat-associated protein
MPSDTIPGKVNETNYEEYSWDPAGNRTSLRRRDRGIAAEVRIIAYGYDRLNRMVAKTLPGTEPDVAYTYDNLGRQLSASQPGHALTFTYDALNRKRTETGPLGTVTSTYDPQGRRSALVYPGTGLTLSFDHLDTGEVTRIRENGATSGVGVLATYTYDNLGRRMGLARGNGANATYTYTGSRLTLLAENPAGATHDLTLTFAHNKAGQIVTLTKSNDLFAYAPVAGTLATPSDRLNQLASVGAAAATHDPRGNMTSDGTRMFTYDSENRLISGSGGNTLAYDPLGRLYQQAVAAGVTTRFLYDGDAMIGEYSGSNLLQRRFVHGPAVDEPLVWYEGATRKWWHADERGSLIGLSDGTGSVTSVNRYDDYGVPQGAVAGRFGYTGQAWLPELGLSYYKARVYHPALGRFMQVDPVGYDGGINLYRYASSDPINAKDASGNVPVVAIVVGCARIPVCRQAAVAGGKWVAREFIGKAIAPLLEEAHGDDQDSNTGSPEISADELTGKSRGEIERLADEKGLREDPTRPGRYRDPETGEVRIRVDSGHIDQDTGKPYDNPNAARDHVHGYNPDGTKIVDPKTKDPHFPIKE